MMPKRGGKNLEKFFYEELWTRDFGAVMQAE